MTDERQEEIEALKFIIHEVAYLAAMGFQEAHGDETSKQRENLRRLLARLEAAQLHQPQTPETGLGAVVGKWPGDETDEQVVEGLAGLRGDAAPDSRLEAASVAHVLVDATGSSPEDALPYDNRDMYDPSVPPIEETLEALAEGVPDEQWPASERTLRLADALAVVGSVHLPGKRAYEVIAERLTALAGGAK